MSFRYLVDVMAGRENHQCNVNFQRSTCRGVGQRIRKIADVRGIAKLPTSESVKHDRTMPGKPSPCIPFSTLRGHQGEGAPEWLDRLYIYMAISIRIMNGDFYSIVSSLGLYNLCGLSYAQLYAP